MIREGTHAHAHTHTHTHTPPPPLRLSLPLCSVIRAAVVDVRPALIQLQCRTLGYYPLYTGGGGKPGCCSTAANSSDRSDALYQGRPTAGNFPSSSRTSSLIKKLKIIFFLCNFLPLEIISFCLHLSRGVIKYNII